MEVIEPFISNRKYEVKKVDYLQYYRSSECQKYIKRVPAL